MAETIVADPAEEVPGRVEFDITPYIAGQGPDFGDAAVEAFYADAKLGRSVVDYTVPNRIVTIPLVLRSTVTHTFDELRSMLQAKVGLWQREGGVLKRETAIGTVYADVETAQLKLGGSTAQAILDVDADAVLILECIPDWYGEEIDLDVESGAGDLVRVLTPARGDHPGRIRIIVSDDSGVAQRGLLWGIRSRHTSDDATAELAYEASDLTLLDAAGLGSNADATGGTYVEHGDLGTTWTPVLSTDLAVGGALTHTGSYRIWARAYSTSSTPPRLRLAWDVGDLVYPIFNSPAPLPAANAFYPVDLGEVRLDQLPSGHRWRGIIQAQGAVGGENVAVDRILLQPLDEFAGTLQAIVIADSGLQEFSARDEFNQSAGNLTGKTAPVGGNWTGAGDVTDFAVEATGHTAQRTQISDASLTAGRYAISGVADMAATVAQVDLSTTGVGLTDIWPNNVLFGVLARYVDTNNWAGAFLGGGGSHGACFAICVGGSLTRISIDGPSRADGQWLTVRLLISDDGFWHVWLGPQGSRVQPAGTGYDARLATGGALDTGKPGFYEAYTLATALTRNFDNFAAWVPDPEAVIHANRSLELRTDGADRLTADGDSNGPVSWLSGDLPRMPAAGLEERTVELLVKPSRGDLDQLPDPSPDDTFEVEVFYRPSYLYVPDGRPGS